MNEAGYILYIELIALGTYKSVDIEPMNVFRVAVMKNASRVIAVHNHPTGRLEPSASDKEVTDRLIQVGRILNITFVDHLIISPIYYSSFRATGLMDELELSLKFVPTYQIVDQIRKQEKAIARDKLKSEKEKTKAAKEQAKMEQERRTKLELAMATTLFEKGIDIDTIAKIMEITPKQIQTIFNRINNK